MHKSAENLVFLSLFREGQRDIVKLKGKWNTKKYLSLQSESEVKVT